MRSLHIRLLATIALLLVLGLTGAVRADDSSGKFKEALADNSTFTVTEGDQEHTYQLAKDAAILIDAQIRTLSDLKAGDMVQITWENRDGRRLASMVTCNRQ